MATAARTSERPPTIRAIDPATGEQFDEIATTSPQEVRNIVDQARKVAPEWAAIPPEGRVRMLREVRYRMYERIDEIVETVMRQGGKPRLEALAHEVLPTALTLLYLEKVTPKTLRPERPFRLLGPLLGSVTRIEWRPFGVVGAITPWNYPLFNCFLAFVPALFAGNVVVIKPSEVTPAVGELVRDLLEPLPSGVATVIQGGADVGAALVGAPCDKISFIGSPETGRKICAAAAEHLTPVVMELGGKDAAVVLHDADLDVATSGVLWGKFLNCGQTCCAIERVYVHESIADEFKEAITAKAARLRQQVEGDVGSLTFGPQLDIVKEQVADAVGKGARVLTGGLDATSGNGDGALWFAPTIVEGVTDEMKLMQEETFGPVLPIITVRDEDEAIRRANEEGVNLTASVWSSDARRAERLAQHLRAGTVTINTHADSLGVPANPWGGVGESGFGRLNGKLGLREFTVAVPVVRNPQPKMKRLWWYPYDQASTQVLRGMSEALSARHIGDKLEGVKKVASNLRQALRNKL